MSDTLSKDELYKETFSRNTSGILTEAEQDILRNSTVAVAGSGGGGGISAERIARLGVGGIKLADPEVFDHSNKNRQFGCTTSVFGKKKAVEVGKILQDINPELKVDIFPDGLTKSNIDEFLDGADILVEEVEGYFFKIRALVYSAARAKGIYAVRADTFGFCSPLFVFDPNGMTFEQFFELPPIDEIPDDMADASHVYIEKFLLGKRAPAGYPEEHLAKMTKKEKPFSCLSFGCSLIGTLTCSEVVKILLNKGERVVAPKVMNVDLYNRTIEVVDFSDHC